MASALNSYSSFRFAQKFSNALLSYQNGGALKDSDQEVMLKVLKVTRLRMKKAIINYRLQKEMDAINKELEKINA